MEAILGKYSRYIGAIITIGIVGMLMYNFSDIVTWVVLSWVISLLGSPLMKLLGKIRYKQYGIPSSIRALIVLGFFCGIVGLFLYLFVPVIVQQGRNLARVDYAALMKSLEEPIAHFSDLLIEKGLIEGELSEYAHPDSTNSILFQQNIDSISSSPSILTTTTINIDSILLSNGDTITKTNINLNIAVSEPNSKYQHQLYDTTALVHASDTPLEQLRKKIFQYISPSQLITQTVFYMVGFFGNFLILFSSVTFIAFFFLKDEELFGRAIKAAIPNKQLGKTDTALIKIKQLLTRYFSGILLQMTLIMLYISVVLSLLGVPNAILIAFFAGIINVIPYLGPFIGASFAVLVTISSNLDADFYLVTLPMLFKVAGVFASMQFLDGFIFQPVIFSNSVSAHPIEIFLVVVIGAKLGGITGMVIALPTYTIFRVIGAVFLQEFKLIQNLTKNINDPNDGIPDHHEKIDPEVEQ